MITENLYDNWNEYWMDIQLNTNRCDECNKEMSVMKSTPIKKLNNGYIFVCSDCKQKDWEADELC